MKDEERLHSAPATTHHRRSDDTSPGGWSCGGCGEDFNSLKLFDRHRVGVHAYSISEGLRMDPLREDGRRCLYEHEMEEAGWRRNRRGRWIDPVEVARTVSTLTRIAETASGDAP